MNVSGLKNINMLSKEQYDGISSPSTDELYAISGSGFGLPSSRYENLTLGASDSTYTAPANGYFCLAKYSTASGQYLLLANNTSGVRIYDFSSANNQPLTLFLPARKGDIIKVSYTAAGTSDAFKFIYNEGEN